MTVLLFHSEYGWLGRDGGTGQNQWAWSDHIEDATEFPDLPTALAVADLLGIEKIRALEPLN